MTGKTRAAIAASLACVLAGCAGAYVGVDSGKDRRAGPSEAYASASARTLAPSTKSSGLGATVAFQ